MENTQQIHSILDFIILFLGKLRYSGSWFQVGYENLPIQWQFRFKIELNWI